MKDLLARAYGLDGTPEAWLTGLAEAAAPLLGGAVIAFRFARVDERVVVSDVVASGARPADVAAFVGGCQVASSRFLERAYFCPPQVSTLSEALAPRKLVDDPVAAPWLPAVSVRDVLVIKGHIEADVGVGMCAILTEETSLEARARWDWERVGAHLAAAARARRATTAPTGELPTGTEAVLDRRGAVVHAEGAARAGRTLLSEHVVRRGDGDDLDLWPALVEGRWSLVDHVDTDGRKFVLARSNAPGAPGPSALSPRERQVVQYAALGQSLKLIAYELGIAESSVSTLLRRAMHKLGIRTRAELSAIAHARP